MQVLGYLTAFLTAMLVVIVDCNSALRAALHRVPLNVVKCAAVWILAAACVAVSAVCFAFSYSSFLRQIVDLKWAFPPGRGLLVGLAVLTIIRSKFFNFKDTEVGGEFFYNSGRAWAINTVWRKWRRFKENYASDARIGKAFTIPEFENRTIEAADEVIKLQPQDYKDFVHQQFANFQKTRPALPPDAADTKWQAYYRAFIKLVLDCCGEECFPPDF
jgi:hypothetical protein